MRRNFSRWAKWCDRNTLDGIHFPGIYALALPKKEIAGGPFSWRQDIIYIGMTNSKGGLKSRLQQFENTIKGGGGHGGAQRVSFKYHNYSRLAKRLRVAIYPRNCRVESNEPKDLATMGRIAKHEYDCFAAFVEMFGRLPEFNDKKKSPKK